jgi:Zn-dependent protease/CBS domain-containing protein
MFGKGITLGHLFGIPIHIDLSWLVIVGLLTYTLAEGTFPALAGSEAGILLGLDGPLPRATCWLMGLLGSIGFFASLLLHELSHALTARRFGIKTRGITLFLFGGVAEMGSEPPSPRAELAVAIAGPVISCGLGFAALGAAIAGSVFALPPAVNGVLGFLGWANLLLAVFNLIPAFPLDGGRVLRATLWWFLGDLRRATRIGSGIGSGFGVVLVAVGAVELVLHRNPYGLWTLLVGLFLRRAARLSYQQLLLSRNLEGETVARFMQQDPVTVPRAISVAELVQGYIYRHRVKLFPVVDGERLLGCVTTRRVQQLPRDEWEHTTVGAVTQACSPDNTVAPGDDAMHALAVMSRLHQSRLLVVDGERLVGILNLKDLLDFLSLKMELEGR